MKYFFKKINYLIFRYLLGISFEKKNQYYQFESCEHSYQYTMDLSVDSEANTESNVTQVKEEGDKETDDASWKKLKIEKSVEEDQLEGLDGEGYVEEHIGQKNKSVSWLSVFGSEEIRILCLDVRLLF